MAGALQQSEPDDHHAESQPTCVAQRRPFFELSAEIRNRIYEFAMPFKERGDAQLVASPACDDQMPWAVQPGITRASRQTREKLLQMFYANNDFRAHIEHLNFRWLIQWAKYCSTLFTLNEDSS